MVVEGIQAAITITNEKKTFMIIIIVIMRIVILFHNNKVWYGFFKGCYRVEAG